MSRLHEDVVKDLFSYLLAAMPDDVQAARSLYLPPPPYLSTFGEGEIQFGPWCSSGRGLTLYCLPFFITSLVGKSVVFVEQAALERGGDGRGDEASGRLWITLNQT